MESATLLAALEYVARTGGPKIADAVRKKVQAKGWARRAAREAFKPVPRPKLRRQLARWLRRPTTLDDVLLAPDRPGETALRELDQVFASASGRWRELAEAERHRRLEIVLGRVYDAVLSEREPGWAIRISTARLTGLAERTQEKIAEVDRGVDELRDMARSAADQGNEQDLMDRLRQLPPIDRDSLVNRWRDAREDVWAIVTALTGPDAPAAQVIANGRRLLPSGWSELR